jgi:hypothetical protein
MVPSVIEFTIQQDGSAQQIYALLKLQKSHFFYLELVEYTKGNQRNLVGS